MSERVNVCVIVGNGFDMAAGLDTSTKAFVESFAERHNEADSPAGRLAAKIKQEGPENWADFERKLGEYAVTVEESSTKLMAWQSSSTQNQRWKMILPRS